METTCPVIVANVSDHYFPSSTPPQARRSFQLLLELEIDGTIRYSNIYPHSTFVDGRNPVVGSNLFERPDIGDLSSFRRDFVAFAKGDKNRQTFQLRNGNGTEDGSAVIVLTRSFGTTEAGRSSEVILMELKWV
jgi:hypothetical protein